jgi:hypothetical protein
MLAVMNKFDRVFQRHDVPQQVSVNLIDHR